MPSYANDPQGLMRRLAPNKQTIYCKKLFMKVNYSPHIIHHTPRLMIEYSLKLKVSASSQSLHCILRLNSRFITSRPGQSHIAATIFKIRGITHISSPFSCFLSGFYVPPTSKETRSVTLNIFRKKYFLFKSFVKIELSYVFTLNMFSTAESCIEQ